MEENQKPYVWVVVHEIDREPKAVFSNEKLAIDWATAEYGSTYTDYYEITIHKFLLNESGRVYGGQS